MVTVVWLLFTSGLSAQALNNRETEIIDRWVKMWNSYDLLEVDSLFDHQATYFSSEYEGLISGRENLQNHHQKFGFIPGGKKTGNTLWLENLTVQIAGAETLIVTGTWHFLRKEAIRPQRGPVTFVLGKKAGTWKILHAHFANSP